MSALAGYEPLQPIRFFEELCAIPHGSRNMKEISDYCVKFSNDRGLKVIQDEYYNIIITKEATEGYEDKDGIILQGHLDMVCEKVSGSDFDFEKDGLILETDGEWIWAKDTSLGGDDGVAVAIALAILDSKDIPHPKLEAIFTVDEEIGLVGAQDIDLSSITGKKLINIDSEDDSQILTSCAGGAFLEGKIPVKFETKSGIEYAIEVCGLLGGHSGAEIHKGRGNSNVLMGRVLHAIGDCAEISCVQGGTANNVIPSHTAATVLVQAADESKVKEIIESISSEIKKEFLLCDPDVKVVVTRQGESTKKALDSNSKLLLKNALMNLPNGIQAMSFAIPDLVETSTNMGVCKIDDEQIIVKYNVRSSMETAKNYLVERTSLMFESMGGVAILHGDYPGWEYKIDSELRESVVKVYTNLFGKAPIIGAVHAGLECGLFGKKIENLDCVSIGPNLVDIHSYNEKLEITSFERIWKLVIGVLADKKQ